MKIYKKYGILKCEKQSKHQPEPIMEAKEAIFSGTLQIEKGIAAVSELSYRRVRAGEKRHYGLQRNGVVAYKQSFLITVRNW